jgi:hypothetical protein
VWRRDMPHARAVGVLQRAKVVVLYFEQPLGMIDARVRGQVVWGWNTGNAAALIFETDWLCWKKADEFVSGF